MIAVLSAIQDICLQILFSVLVYCSNEQIVPEIFLINWQYAHARPPAESKQQRGEAPMLQKRLVAFTSSLSSLGGTIGNAIEVLLQHV